MQLLLLLLLHNVLVHLCLCHVWALQPESSLRIRGVSPAGHRWIMGSMAYAGQEASQHMSAAADASDQPQHGKGGSKKSQRGGKKAAGRSGKGGRTGSGSGVQPADSGGEAIVEFFVPEAEGEEDLQVKGWYYVLLQTIGQMVIIGPTTLKLRNG